MPDDDIEVFERTEFAVRHRDSGKILGIYHSRGEFRAMIWDWERVEVVTRQVIYMPWSSVDR